MRISDWSSDVCSSDLTRRKEHGDIVRRRHDGEVADAQITGRTDGVEADRHAGRGVPDQLRWRIDPHRYRDDVDGCDHRHQRSPAKSHRSEEHTYELQSLMRISYAVFCWKKKKYITP